MTRPAYVITTCGNRKHNGPAPAAQFYKGSFVARQAAAAEALRPKHGRLILSNKYGYMGPTTIVPGPYDSHWGCPDTMSDTNLRRQIATLTLKPGDYVVCLGAREYARQTRRLFPDYVTVVWPPMHLPDKRMGYQAQMMNRWALTRSIGKCRTRCIFTPEMV